MSLKMKKYELIEIESIKKIDFCGEVFDLEVEDDRSYNIEDIAVHNSVCTTRIKTGVGYPQLSSIIECADVAHGLRGHVCADGGCTTPGDIAKSFGAGADFVMLGGMLSGTDECEGEWEEIGETCQKPGQAPYVTGNMIKKSLKFYGMSSKEAMEQFGDGQADYKAAEGKCVRVPYKGPVKEIFQEIMGGLRSACTYVGTENLKDFSKCCTFVKVNRTHNTIYGQ